jgi:hypothetical protein
MPKDNRPFITVAVDMDRNPKYASLNDAQKFLIIRAWLHCAEFLTDGFISMAAWRKMGTDRNRKAILECGACSVVAEQNGVLFHDYLEHQQSRAEVESKREKARSAGQKGGQAKAANAKRTPSGSPSGSLASAKRISSESVPDIDIEEENSSYVPSASLVSNASASEATYERPGKPVPVDGWRLVRDRITAEHPQAVRTALATEAATLLHAGTSAEDVGSALDLWLTKSNLGPRTLPNLVSEVIRTRTRPAQTTAVSPLAGNDREVAEILQRGKRLADQARAQQKQQPALPPSILESSA